MVGRDSRYARLAPEALRLLPDVDGEFEHTVVDGDRLDHLASKYYRDPRRWWRICDANPEILSPLELVGAGPLRTLHVPLGPEAKPSDVAKNLRRDPGVVRLSFADDPLSDRVTAVVTYNRMLLDERAVLELFKQTRDSSAPAHAPGRAGERITIPPDGTG